MTGPNNTCQPLNSTLQNEILTASIAQEIEKMEIKTGGRKKAVNADKEQRERRKGEERRSLTSTFNEAIMRPVCLVSKMMMNAWCMWLS